MKNYFNRIIVAFVAMIVALGATACAGGSGNGGGASAGGKDNLEIFMWTAGYGSDYMKAVITAFKDKNPDINVELKLSSAPAFSDIYLDPDNNSVDLYFTTAWGYSAYNEYLEPLNDIVNTEVDGVTIASKIGESTVDLLTAKDGNVYSIPWANGVCGLFYNATVFEQNGYKAPKTTRQLADLCATMVSDKQTPFIYYKEYWKYMINGWMAQYATVANFNKYNLGVYTFDDGTTSENSIDLFINNTARDKALEVLPSLIGSKGYIYTGTNTLTHTVSQTYFLNGRGLMIPTGSWLEYEMRNSISDKTPDIKIMKYPVLSSVGQLLGLNENQLVAVVAYVDGDATAAQKEFVDSLENKEAVVERVREARNVYFSERIGHGTFIPKKSDAKEAAKKFLQFYYSDEGLKIIEDTCGMLLPAKYGDGSVRKSNSDTTLITSCLELQGNEYASSVERSYTIPLFYNAGIENFWYFDPIGAFSYNANTSQIWTYNQYLEKEKSYWNDNWSQILIDAGLA